MSPHDAVLVGCGGRAQTHARVLAESEAFELAAVCDLDAERARETAARFDVPATYTDLHEAIPAVGPAHVSAVTPPTVRRSLVEDVLSHDPASLLIEKPVATTFEEVRAVARAARSADTRVTVCHQHVYLEELGAVGRWIDAGRLGHVDRLLGSTKGGLFEHGTHVVHALNWLLDATPTRVRAHTDWTGEDRAGDWHDEVEPDETLLELTYPGNRRAVYHLGPDAVDIPEQAGRFYLERRLDAVGDRGHARYVLGDHAFGRFTTGTERVDVGGFDTGGYATAGLYADLAACLEGRRESHPSDFESALAAHRVVEAALRSGEEGRGVDLDEVSV